MIEKDFARLRQLDTAGASHQQLHADFVFQIADLPAERGLCRVKPSFGGNRQAAFLRHGDEIMQMSKLHGVAHTF
jgi:hypothetical protein